MAPRLPLLLAAAAQLQQRPVASLAAGGRTAPSASDFAATVPALLANGGECDLCGGEQQWLFILSAGQSGSASLQEMLSAVPGVYIAGENFGVMNLLLEEYEAMGKIVMRSDRGEPGFQTRPISQRHVLCAMQTVMRNAIGTFKEGDTSVIGFEETRHTSRHQLDFFGKVFPCARFILSSWRSSAASDQVPAQLHALESFRNATRELDLWQERHHQNAFTMKLEDLSVDSANELLSWIGVEGWRFSEVPRADESGSLSGRSRVERWA